MTEKQAKRIITLLEVIVGVLMLQYLIPPTESNTVFRNIWLIMLLAFLLIPDMLEHYFPGIYDNDSEKEEM